MTHNCKIRFELSLLMLISLICMWTKLGRWFGLPILISLTFIIISKIQCRRQRRERPTIEEAAETGLVSREAIERAKNGIR